MEDETLTVENTESPEESFNSTDEPVEVLENESIDSSTSSPEPVSDSNSLDIDYSNYLIDLNISLETFKQEYHDNYLEQQELSTIYVDTLNHVYSSINTLCMLLALFFVTYLLMGWIHEEK